jgi:NADPH:quinone reductase-like Zn-dependent oxidoreductase
MRAIVVTSWVTQASERLLDHVDAVMAAALPVHGLTAYGLANFASTLTSGQTALVHAAAGGVGALLLQLLQHRGDRVFGTASSTTKQNLVRDLGAIPQRLGFVRPSGTGKDTVGPAAADMKKPHDHASDSGAETSDPWAWVELNYRPHAYQAST